MNKKRTLVWTLAAVATVVVAQVQRADFSSMQKAASSHPEKQFAQGAVPGVESLNPVAIEEEAVAEETTQ